MFELPANLRAGRPDLRVIVTGLGMEAKAILKAVASGVKGYVDIMASPTNLSGLSEW